MRAQSVTRQHRKRNSERSEMVTYNYVTEVVRNRCDNHQAKRVDSRAIVLLIAISVGALIIWIIKQTDTNIASQTKKLSSNGYILVMFLPTLSPLWRGKSPKN